MSAIGSAQEPLAKVSNSIGMELVRIPKGSFQMGSPKNEKGRRDDETAHLVTISEDYYLATTEVTQGQYAKVMGTNPSKYPTVRSDDMGLDHPVDQVKWEDAFAFCEELSELPEERKAGRRYRLPTEAEWEYACRAGSTTAFSFGDQGVLADFAWFSENAKRSTQKVKQKKPNPWGLFDMQGNVWEFCSDFYDDYPDRNVTDPEGPDEGNYAAVRGASFVYDAADCRSARRYKFLTDHKSDDIGFRVVLEVSRQ